MQVEKLLIEQNRLREQKALLEGSLTLKEKELQLLQRAAPAQPKVTAKQFDRVKFRLRGRWISVGLMWRGDSAKTEECQGRAGAGRMRGGDNKGKPYLRSHKFTQLSHRCTGRPSTIGGVLCVISRSVDAIVFFVFFQLSVGIPKPPGLQIFQQPNAQNPPKWPSQGVPVLNKTPVVRGSFKGKVFERINLNLHAIDDLAVHPWHQTHPSEQVGWTAKPCVWWLI